MVEYIKRVVVKLICPQLKKTGESNVVIYCIYKHIVFMTFKYKLCLVRGSYSFKPAIVNTYAK